MHYKQNIKPLEVLNAFCLMLGKQHYKYSLLSHMVDNKREGPVGS